MPGPPTNIAISNISPRSVTLQFKPGYDGKTSISRWLVEAQVVQNKFTLRIYLKLSPFLLAITDLSLSFSARSDRCYRRKWGVGHGPSVGQWAWCTIPWGPGPEPLHILQVHPMRRVEIWDILGHSTDLVQSQSQKKRCLFTQILYVCKLYNIQGTHF